MSVQASVAELIDKAARLDTGEFNNFFNKMLTLRAQRIAPVLSKEESDLLKKINRGFPQKKWERLDFLNDKLEYETLSEAEHEELSVLIEAYEEYSLQRMRQLGQLATARKVSLDEVMNQLGIQPHRYG
jgi:hypothetical protein